MSDIIAVLRESGPTLQALAVSLGGLLGVFLTLTIFFFFIWAADNLGKKNREKHARQAE